MRVTPVVRDLMIINGVMLLVTYLLQPFGIDLINILGLHYPKSPLFRPYQIFTHMFMHANLIHLFFNMYALWILGSVLERVMGSRRFLFYYLATGFGAAFLHTAVTWYEIHRFVVYAQQFLHNLNLEGFLEFYKRYPEYFPDYQIRILLEKWSLDPDNPVYASQALYYIKQAIDFKMNIPIVGASGAVFGVLLAFGMLFPEAPLMIMFVPFPIKAKHFVIVYGLMELLYGIFNIPGDNIAHFAHLGGMIFGYFIIKYWKKKGVFNY